MYNILLENSYVDIYSETGIDVGKSLLIQNKSSQRLIINTNTTSQPSSTNTDGYLYEQYNKSPIKIDRGFSNVWVIGTGRILVQEVGKAVSTFDVNDYYIQNPAPSDSDSVYIKDLDIDNCDNGDFSGSITDYFDSLKTVNSNTTDDNPKILKLWFNRTVYSHSIGLGCDNLTGGFGDSITLKLLGSGEVVRKTVISSGDTNSRLIEFGTAAYNGFILEFNTADIVCISNITIQKSIQTNTTIQGTTPDGNVLEVNVTSDGDLSIGDNSSGLSIAEGKVTGKSFIHKFGYAPSISTADDFCTVWDGSDNDGIDETLYNYSTTAAIDSVGSSSALDTQCIQIQGLDASFNLVTQQATLNGQSRVALTTPLLRIFRMKNDCFADLNGYVYVYENTAISGGVPTDTTKVRAIIENGYNQTLMAVYTIPAGYTGYLRDWYCSTAGANKDSGYIIQLRARKYIEDESKMGVFQLKHISSINDLGTSYVQHRYEEPEVFQQKTDIEMRVKMTATGGSGGAISAGFDIVLVEN